MQGTELCIITGKRNISVTDNTAGMLRFQINVRRHKEQKIPLTYVTLVCAPLVACTHQDVISIRDS